MSSDGIARTSCVYSARRLMIARCLAAAVYCLLEVGCGYHVAGQGTRIPPDVKTVGIPIFKSETSRFRIEQQVTSAVTREFIERTKYRVTPEPLEADAVLSGTVKDIRTSVVVFGVPPSSTSSSSTQGVQGANALQIQVTFDIRFVDIHSHKVIFSNPNYIFRDEYQVSQAVNQSNQTKASNPNTLESVFGEDQPAIDRISRDLARTLVSDILENF
jgi:hypothetical protein